MSRPNLVRARRPRDDRQTAQETTRETSDPPARARVSHALARAWLSFGRRHAVREVIVPGEAVDDVRREMERYQWYHTLELGEGLVTPGQYDHRSVLRHYGLPTGSTASPSSTWVRPRGSSPSSSKAGRGAGRDGGAPRLERARRGRPTSSPASAPSTTARPSPTSTARSSSRSGPGARGWSGSSATSTTSGRARSGRSTSCSAVPPHPPDRPRARARRPALVTREWRSWRPSSTDGRRTPRALFYGASDNSVGDRPASSAGSSVPASAGSSAWPVRARQPRRVLRSPHAVVRAYP